MPNLSANLPISFVSPLAPHPNICPTKGPPSSPAPFQTKNSPIGLAIASVPRATSPLNSLDLEASDNRLFSPRKRFCNLGLEAIKSKVLTGLLATIPPFS